MKDRIYWTNAHNVHIEVPLASIGMRALAYVLDGLIKGLFIIFIVFLITRIFTNIPAIGFIFILFCPYLFYSFAFEALNDGQTPGKRICNVKVTSMTGNAPGAQAYFLRWIFRLIDFNLVSQLVALLTAALSEKRQRVGDMVANTVVVDTKVVRRAMYDTYTSVPEQYVPVYPEAKNLKREDTALIKEIMNMQLGPHRDALVIKMMNKMEQTYHIRSNETPRRLLFTLVKDYNYFKLKEETRS